MTTIDTEKNLETELNSNKKDAPKTKESEISNEKEKEYGGPKGLEPTRFGDWEKNGRCSDF